MSFRGKFLVVLGSFMIALYAIFGSLLSTQAQQPINDAGAQIRIFESVLQHIQNDYVDEPNLEKVRYGALRGLADGLDPYSAYLTAEQVKDYQANLIKKKAGIGAEFSEFSSYLYIVSVIKNSPADEAGLQAGDVIEYIGKKATRDISLYDAKQLIGGEAGTKVKLRVIRPGEKPKTVEVPRGFYKVPKVEAKTEDENIGNIKVYSLEKGEAADIRNRVQEFAKKGVSKIVLDLRGVASGDLNEAVETANLFVKSGTLAQVIGRQNKVVNTFTANPAKHIFSGDVAVLIDLGTAGAGEIVAAAIKENKRGEVVGEKSFGAGTEQQLIKLRSGDALLLTIAKWASPSGKPFLEDEILNSGVKPSIEVKRPETPEPVEVENLVEQKEDEDLEPQPDDEPIENHPVEKMEKSKPAQVDVQLNKALEILRGKAKAAGGQK